MHLPDFIDQLPLHHFIAKYDKMRQNTTKYDSYFITKCDKSLILQNTSDLLIQNATVLQQTATVKTKCDDFVTKCDRQLLQNAMILFQNEIVIARCHVYY